MPIEAYASGSYSCCFVDKDGKQYTYTSRASSYYKGSIERLCRVVALEGSVKQCAAESKVTDMAADLDFTGKALPATVGLSRICKRLPCEVGLLVRREKPDSEFIPMPLVPAQW